jgi:hypothetical protein
MTYLENVSGAASSCHYIEGCCVNTSPMYGVDRNSRIWYLFYAFSIQDFKGLKYASREELWELLKRKSGNYAGNR